MAGTTWNRDELWAQLEALGEPVVRERALMGHWGDAGIVGSKRPLVEEWLRLREEARREASSREQILIARSAKNAAWTAAIAATIAAIITIVSITITLLLRK
jgi:hypothetical protein